MGLWISELDEYDYSIEYIPGSENVKADALSRNSWALDDQPSSKLEHKICALFVNNDNFLAQLQEEQFKDLLIRDCFQSISLIYIIIPQRVSWYGCKGNGELTKISQF